MAKADVQYHNLLQTVLDEGVWKQTRSGMVKSAFGKTMEFDLKDGLPLLTTKKVYTKGVINELLWFLKGDTNIKYLIDNNVHIWDDDAFRFFRSLDFNKINRSEDNLVSGYYKFDWWDFNLEALSQRYNVYYSNGLEGNDKTTVEESFTLEALRNMSKEMFISFVMNQATLIRIDEYNGRSIHEETVYTFGDLGPVYGKQWRNYGVSGFDQIKNIIETLKTNPYDRRMILTGWNPDVLDNVALPACHTFAYFWTMELSLDERVGMWFAKHNLNEEVFNKKKEPKNPSDEYLLYKDYVLNKISGEEFVSVLDMDEIPRYALSCSFTCRSQDLFLGTPFNIASYGILTSMIAHCVNMVPEKLIYNGCDVHIYQDHIDAVIEQLERDPNKYKAPTIWFTPEVRDIDSFKEKDIVINHYNSYSAIKAPLSVGQIN